MAPGRTDGPDHPEMAAARNPYLRVDALRSQRHVRVTLGDTVQAETRSPALLFATGLPTRCYLPRTDVRLEHLLPSETPTECPYKRPETKFS